MDNRKKSPAAIRAEKRKKVNQRRVVIILFVFLLLCTTVVFSFSFFIKKNLEPVGAGDIVQVEIPPGYTVTEIATLLKSDGLIKDTFAFEYYVRRENAASYLQSGHYEISPELSVEDIVDMLMTGDVYNTTITIPEGRNISEMAVILESAGICSQEDFIAETQKVAEYQAIYPILDGISLEEKDGVSRSLEGYLFPDTYLLTPDATAEDVVMAMLERFEEVYSEDYLEQTDKMGKTVDEIVIMASLVEMESKYDEDRASVASVFYNRIAADMPLQSDITVDYARGEKTTVLTTEQTQIESPYNTYINLGLPFGPIASFGESSLQAALYPDDTNYLYFVADLDTGKIIFNETYDEHLADVETYLSDYTAGE
ncbi:endolytic transglycosylase MltG [Eubacteriaceae bacterium ES3]|nr:endolytic transglycosylase MltG [Eubacteriaceae bacterium ES3]